MGYPLAALAIRPPAPPPDPLQQAAQLVNLKNMLQTQPLQQQALQQEVQRGALQTQLMQRQVNDMQILQQAAQDRSIDWTKPNAYDQMFDKAVQNGASPQTLLPMQQEIAKLKDTLANTSKTQLQTQIDTADRHRGQLLSTIDADPAQKQQLWEQQVKSAEADGSLQPGQIPYQYPGDQVAAHLANTLAQGSVLAKEAIEKQTADAAVARALKPTYDSLQATANDPKATPEQRSAAQASVDAIDKAGIMKAVATKQAETAVEYGPEAIQGAAAKAGAEQAARAGVEYSPQTTQLKLTQQQKLQGGSNAAVANVPPHLVAAATADATKAGQDYASVQQAVDDMKTFIDEARAGNKIAYSYSPTEGVLTLNTMRGVKRVNMPEIQSLRGAGSAWDNVMGYVGKFTSGASIPKNILDDMASLYQAVGSNAQNAFGNRLKVINQYYGSSFQPVQLGGGAGPGTAGGGAGAGGPRSISLSKTMLRSPGKTEKQIRDAAAKQGFQVVP